MSIPDNLIDINLLVEQTGLPFETKYDFNLCKEIEYITNEDILNAVQTGNFCDISMIYNNSRDNQSYKWNKQFDVSKIATIVNEIQTNKYDYNYTLPVYDDSDDDKNHKYDIDGNGQYHIRAFKFCNKNMPVTIWRSG
jgi:hypothetical protein